MKTEEDEEGHEVATLCSYWRFLQHNRPFRLLFLGEVVNSCGSWFNYVSCMTIVQRLGGSSALLVSGVVVIRVLPAALLFPFAGVVADRFDRVRVLIVVCLLSAATVSALALIQSPAWLWLLYVLLFIQFSLASFYDPARRALTPLLVPREELPLAATLDAFGWSLMAAVGASIGGVAVSSLGTSACFLIDACTFLVAAACSYQLRVVSFLSQEETREEGEGLQKGSHEQHSQYASNNGSTTPADSAFDGSVEASHPPGSAIASGQERQHVDSAASASDTRGHLSSSQSQAGSQMQAQQLIPARPGGSLAVPQHPTAVAPQHELLGGFAAGAVHSMQASAPGTEQAAGASPVGRGLRSQGLHESAEDLEPLQQRRDQSCSYRQNASTAEPSSASQDAEENAEAARREQDRVAVLAEGIVAEGWSEEVAALREGWHYMWAPHNRDVAGLVFIKASGSFVWGASDVLYVRFSELSQMQVVDAATTMGVIFGCMGVGAFIGPIVFNYFTPNKTRYLLRSTAGAFGSLMAGYVLMTAAPSIAFLLPAVVVRSLGAATLWVYSTLLLQYRVENRIQGRIFAVEMAFYTVAETVSGLWGGFMFDSLDLSTQGASGVMAVVAAIITGIWSAYAWQSWQMHSRAHPQALYELVSQGDQETALDQEV